MKKIPFALNGKGSQTQQMVDGIKAAIDARHWLPGEMLPTAAEFKAALGVGGYVPRTALRQLADQGVIVLKRHVGAVVARTGNAASPPRRIAFVTSGCRESYYENVHAFALQGLFERSGYELVHTLLPRSDDGCGRDAFASLQRHLERGLDFAICFTASRTAARMLDEFHVRYIYEGGSGRDFPNAVAALNLELESQEGIQQLAAAWRASDVRNVLVVDFEHIMPRNIMGAFVASGMTVRRLVARKPNDRNYLMGIQQAALDAISRFFHSERNRSHPPHALFFYDDYLAAGGLTALAATGIRIPEDMHVATLSNKGLGPVWFKPLTRLEYDPVGNAELVGEFVLGILSDKAVKPPRLRLRFIQGET